MILYKENQAEALAKDHQKIARHCARAFRLSTMLSAPKYELICDQINARNASATARAILLGLIADK